MKEYLWLFSNSGTVEISVKFVGSKSSIAKRHMSPSEIVKLINEDDPNRFLSHMTFDEYQCEIVKLEINPKTNKLIIHAKHLGSDAY